MECGRQRSEIQTLLLQRNLRSCVLLPFLFKKNAWSQVSSNAVLCVSFTWQKSGEKSQFVRWRSIGIEAQMIYQISPKAFLLEWRFTKVIKARFRNTWDSFARARNARKLPWQPKLFWFWRFVKVGAGWETVARDDSMRQTWPFLPW